MGVIEDAEAVLWRKQSMCSVEDQITGAYMLQETGAMEAAVVDKESFRVEIPACRRAFYQHFVSRLPKKHFDSLREAEQYIKGHLRLLLEFYDQQPAVLGLSPSTPVAAAIYDAWEYIFQLGWLRFSPNSPEVDLVPILA